MSFITTHIYNMALSSKSYKDILAPNTDAIIAKFKNEVKLQDIENTLICAYMREELKADIVSIQMLKHAGYPVSTVLTDKVNNTANIAKRVILKFEGKDIQAEISNPNSAYHKEISNLAECLSLQFKEIEQELGFKSKDYLIKTGVIKKV